MFLDEELWVGPGVLVDCQAPATFALDVNSQHSHIEIERVGGGGIGISDIRLAGYVSTLEISLLEEPWRILRPYYRLEETPLRGIFGIKDTREAWQYWSAKPHITVWIGPPKSWDWVPRAF